MNKTTSAIQSITDFPQLQNVPEPKEKLPRIKVNGVAKVTSRVLEEGFAVKINDKTIRMRYPPSIWNRFPKSHQRILTQNIAFGLTFQLPYLYTSIRRMLYSMPVPLSESFFFKGLAMALPSTAIMQSQKEERITSNLLRRLYDIDYVFSSHKADIPPYNRTSMSDRAIMPFTFGKDSLLTFAIARELGIRIAVNTDAHTLTDLDTLELASRLCRLPIIASGGVGNFEHLLQGLQLQALWRLV